MLDPLVAEFPHHGGGGAEIQAGLVVGRLEELPEQGFEHAHAVVLQVLGQMGVIARDQGIALGFGQPNTAQAQHRWVHHMDQIRVEALEGFSHCGPG